MSYFSNRGEEGLKKLEGRKVTAVSFSDERLTFETDQGFLSYEVEGDCCSYSYLHDFYGVNYLLHGWEVTKVEDHDLQQGDPGWAPEDSGEDDSLLVYGYRLTVDHPLWGPVTSVFSFRNESNGYYGGEIRFVDTDGPKSDQRSLSGDVVGG